MAFVKKAIEVYVDDMIIKSIKKANHFRDLNETFRVFR